jgi:hypothetical protein
VLTTSARSGALCFYRTGVTLKEALILIFLGGLIFLGCDASSSRGSLSSERLSLISSNSQIDIKRGAISWIDRMKSPNLHLTQDTIDPTLPETHEGSFLSGSSSSLDSWSHAFLKTIQERGGSAESLCGLISSLDLPKDILNIVSQNASALKYPQSMMWMNLQVHCQQLKTTQERVHHHLTQNQNNASLRSALSTRISDLHLELASIDSNLERTARKYFFLRGFLVNPADAVHEISIPNVFEAKYIFCKLSTDCSALRDLEAIATGGLKRRVLLKPTRTQFYSKGRIEVLVKSAGTEKVYLRNGREVEWIIFEEADPSVLASIQSRWLLAQSELERLKSALNDIPDDLSVSLLTAELSRQRQLIKNVVNLYDKRALSRPLSPNLELR